MPDSHPDSQCDSQSTIGDCVVTRVENSITGKPELRIDRADTHILITDEMVEQAFNEPSEPMFGRILLDPLRLFVVLNGRNRQVRYLLAEHRPTEHVWEAALSSPAPRTDTKGTDGD
jgi:hypothetical protein